MIGILMETNHSMCNIVCYFFVLLYAIFVLYAITLYAIFNDVLLGTDNNYVPLCIDKSPPTQVLVLPAGRSATPCIQTYCNL